MAADRVEGGAHTLPPIAEASVSSEASGDTQQKQQILSSISAALSAADTERVVASLMQADRVRRPPLPATCLLLWPRASLSLAPRSRSRTGSAFGSSASGARIASGGSGAVDAECSFV